MKKQGRSKTSWKKRWFALSKYQLQYFKRPESARPQGSVAIGDIRRVDTAVPECSEPFTFQLVRARGAFAMPCLAYSCVCARACPSRGVAPRLTVDVTLCA
jgi:hypothetical protein